MFSTLLQNVEIIEKHQDAILDSWMQCEVVEQTLLKHGFKINFYKEKFAAKVLEFAISVVKSENKVGSCPVIGVMLLLFKKKNIPLSDIFIICVHLKNTLLTFMQKNSLLDKHMLDEISYLMDHNFGGVINDYVALYYKDTSTATLNTTKNIHNTQEAQQTSDTTLASKEHTTSALEYLEEVAIDMEIIAELDELESDALDAIDAQESITHHSLIESANLFEQYAKVLNMMYEFDELSYTLTILKELLHTAPVETIDEKMLTMIGVYLKAIISDLQSWRMGIFITKEVVDIHYLDKTLMSSIAQLEVLLMPQNESSNGEEIEFF